MYAGVFQLFVAEKKCVCIKQFFISGCTITTKYVGVFIFAYVGISTVEQLWSILGDGEVSPSQFIAHFLARILALLLVPVLVYLAAFFIHFLVLINEGAGTTYFHPDFQVHKFELKPIIAEIYDCTKIMYFNNKFHFQIDRSSFTEIVGCFKLHFTYSMQQESIKNFLNQKNFCKKLLKLTTIFFRFLQFIE